MTRGSHLTVNARRAVAVCATFFVFERGALASPEYPGVIRDTWGVGAPPWWKGGGTDGCFLCHTTETNPDPGKKVGTPVGRWFKNVAGLGPAQKAGLTRALGDNQRMAIDSDMDGHSDYDEVAVDHTDPNNPRDFARPPPPPPPMMDGGVVTDAMAPPAPEPTSLPPPVAQPPSLQTGCSVRSRTQPSRPGVLLVLFTLAASAAVRRLRDRRLLKVNP